MWSSNSMASDPNEGPDPEDVGLEPAQAGQDGHNENVAQPHGGPGDQLADAEAEAADLITPEAPLGRPGRRWDRRSPFLIGMTAAAGVLITVGVAELVVSIRWILILVGVALFLAIGVEPAVSWLVRHGVRRGLAVVLVFVVGLAVIGGFLAAAIPVIVDQASQVVTQLPYYAKEIQDHNSTLGQLNDKFQIQQRLTSLLNSSGSDLVGGLLGAGEAVFSAVTDVGIVVVLTIYFVADLPRLRSFAYRLFPATRRPRAILIGDEIAAKVGGYVLGNLLISLIAGLLTFCWMTVFNIPYALLVAITMAILDLIPIVGSTIGGVLVCAVALTISWPVCLATIGFIVAYRLAEDYLLVPKIIGGVLKVPALVTVVAVLLGGALMGIVGALVAIPAAAAILLLARELLFPRLDRA
jgi:predicted PurR-regulated permease PerM